MSKEIASTIGPISGFVPQIFFDVIARIIPGSFLLLCAYFLVIRDPLYFYSDINEVLNNYKKQEGAKFILFFGFVFASYMTSVILEGLYRIIKLIFNKRWHAYLSGQIKETEDVAISYINSKNYKTFNAKIFPDIFIMYDSIRLQNPAAGSRLVKLRAEYHMARVIVIGLIILSITNIYYISREQSFFMSELFFVFSIICLSFMFLQRRKEFLWGLHNHWVLLNENKILNNDEGKSET